MQKLAKLGVYGEILEIYGPSKLLADAPIAPTV